MTHAHFTPAPHAAPACPHCDLSGSIVEARNGLQQCVQCRWKGRVQDFVPPPRIVEQAKAAMPDDVTCAYHPSKKAVNVCAGTGSYICSLCTLELEGETYSAPFINSGGLKQAKKKNPFERTLQRPDYAIGGMVLLTIFPYCMPLAPVWLGIGIYQFMQHRRMMREDAVYARVTRPVKTLLMLSLLVLMNGMALVGLVALGISSLVGV